MLAPRGEVRGLVETAILQEQGLREIEFVSHNEAALERTDPASFWRHVIEPRFDTYLGRLFERVTEQAYQWLQPQLQLPVVREWGRWEGKDRRGESLEVVRREMGPRGPGRRFPDSLFGRRGIYTRVHRRGWREPQSSVSLESHRYFQASSWRSQDEALTDVRPLARSAGVIRDRIGSASPYFVHY